MSSRIMNRDELIVDIQNIPQDKKGIKGNLRLLLKHAQYLGTVNDIHDPKPRGILQSVPSYIRKQIVRLQNRLDDEVDIVAWISRNLMELFFMLRYMSKSEDNYDEVMREQLKDLKDIEDIIFPAGSPSSDDPEELRRFHSNMNEMWETLADYGVNRDELERYKTVRSYAEGADLLNEYDRGYRLHSKYVHPTSYLLFGRKSFVYGRGTQPFFWVMAQYYAARVLHDLHVMIEQAREHSNDK